MFALPDSVGKRQLLGGLGYVPIEGIYTNFQITNARHATADQRTAVVQAFIATVPTFDVWEHLQAVSAALSTPEYPMARMNKFMTDFLNLITTSGRKSSRVGPVT